MNEAIEAAQLAAHATIWAAVIQGFLTLMAGVVAIVGGWLAYRGAIAAAARQVRLAEERDEARVSAYRFRIGVLADDLECQARFSHANATLALQRFREGGGSHPVLLGRWPQFPEFAPESWENHALLGQAAVRAIHNLWQSLDECRLFQEEVSKERLRSDSFSSRSRPIGAIVEGDDGSITVPLANVVELDEILTREMVAAVDNLKAVI